MGQSQIITPRAVWKQVTVEVFDGYVEAIEHKGIQTIIVLLILLLPTLLFVAILVKSVQIGRADSGTYCCAVFTLFFVALFCLIIYQPPRRLRLYHGERVAQTALTMLGVPLWWKWHDLSELSFEVVSRPVLVPKTYSDEPANWRDGLGCLMLFSGPIGWVISLLMVIKHERQFKGHYIQKGTAYAIVLDRDHPISTLTFNLQKPADMIVRMYKDGVIENTK